MLVVIGLSYNRQTNRYNFDIENHSHLYNILLIEIHSHLRILVTITIILDRSSPAETT